MSNDRQPPPQPVRSYAAGVQARNAERQAERLKNPVLPNLGQAAVSYRPNEGPQTLEQIADTQRRDDDAPPERASLSPGTVDGLRALHEAQVKAMGSTPPAPPARAAEPAAPAPDEEVDAADMEFAEALKAVREDVIQNDAERLAVAKRVKEIDLSEGLLTGEFTQLVPIVPDALTVRFRCLTTGENNELRLYLYDEIDKDPRKANLARELVGFYQTVASVVSMNKTTYAAHMEPEGPYGRLKFVKEVFEQKVATFMSFPLPLIASLGTHSGWFEMRVRDLFATADRLKNG